MSEDTEKKDESLAPASGAEAPASAGAERSAASLPAGNGVASESASAAAEHSSIEYAAEEPTAMWTDEMLRAQGVHDAAKHTAVQGAASAPQLDFGHNPDYDLAKKAPAAAAGPSWPLVIAVALVVGFAVFFAIRALRG